MAGRLAPRTVALVDQILAALDEEFPLPIPTMNLLAKLNAHVPDTFEGRDEAIRAGRMVYYTALMRQLTRLARLGEVEKIKPEGMQDVYWRRWPACPDDAGSLATT